MEEKHSLVDFSGFAKPVDTLNNKISEAIGGIFKPWQIKRVAKAEAEAEIIKEIGRMKLNELQQRALTRFIYEETKKQENIESIIMNALPFIENKAKPENMDNDWITNFFDKCRLISDNEMQIIWGRILSGEANSPGTYSKRTVNLLSTLDKYDAELFMNLCRYVWVINGDPIPLVIDVNNKIYKDLIKFDELNHLDTIGLIKFEPVSGYALSGLSQKEDFSYFGKNVNVTFKNEIKESVVDIVYVAFSKIGYELYRVVNNTPIPEFFNISIQYWREQGINVEIPEESTS